MTFKEQNFSKNNKISEAEFYYTKKHRTLWLKDCAILKNTCPTRWVEREDAANIFLLRLLPVQKSLTQIFYDNHKESDLRVHINEINHSTHSPENIVALFSAKLLLLYTTQLGKILQTKNLNLYTAFKQCKVLESIYLYLIFTYVL